MAIKSLNWVFEHSETRGSGRLVMLAVADAWNSDLGYSFMYVSTLAAKTNLSPRAVRDGVAQAVALGELYVDYKAGGPEGMRAECNRFYLPALTGDQGLAPVAQSAAPSGRKGARRGALRVVDEPESGDGVRQNLPGGAAESAGGVRQNLPDGAAESAGPPYKEGTRSEPEVRTSLSPLGAAVAARLTAAGLPARETDIEALALQIKNLAKGPATAYLARISPADLGALLAEITSPAPVSVPAARSTAGISPTMADRSASLCPHKVPNGARPVGRTGQLNCAGCETDRDRAAQVADDTAPTPAEIEAARRQLGGLVGSGGA